MNQLNFIMFLVLAFITNNASAQYGGCYSKEDLQNKFLTTKTLVLITGDEVFDANLKKGMEEYWTFTEYEFVDNERLNEIGYAAEYSVMQPMSMIRTDQYGSNTYNYWEVILPTDIGVGVFENMVARVLLDGFGREKEYTGAAYRAKHIVKFLSNFITMKLDDKINCGCGANKAFLKKYFNRSSGKIKNNTLLVDEYYLTSVNKDNFSKYYPGKIKYVSTEELEEYINNGEEGYCYLLPVFNRNKRIYIVDTETGKIYFELYATSGIKLTKKDLNAIGKAVFN